LSQIAEANNIALATLMSLNEIGDANDIFVGQVLQLVSATPARLKTTPSATAQAGAVSPRITRTPTLSGMQTPFPTPTPRPATHQVQAGETLSQIGEQYDLDVATLMEINRITNPHAVYRGQELRLIADEATATEATATVVTPTIRSTRTVSLTPAFTATAGPDTHTVQGGETLGQIAEQYDVDVDVLMRLNEISNPNAIYRGQVLRLKAEQVADSARTATPPPTPTPNATPTQAKPQADSTPTPSSGSGEPTFTPTPRPTGTPTDLSTQTPESTPEPELVERRPDNRIATLNQIYTIESGDTLQRIALRTGIDLESLRRLNRLDEAETNWLSVGTTLTLPATGNELRFVTPDQEYTVRAGDSLGQIATQFDRSITQLLQANYISNPNAIYPGQSLIIPAEKLATRAGDEAVGPVRSGFYYYTVQAGDTLSVLAERFDSTKLAILDYNNLPDEETVYLGLELQIPFGPPPLDVEEPPTPASGTRFVVSISRQQCWILQGKRMLHSWPCSTGYGEWRTRLGVFAVQSKIDNAPSQAYQLDMPYWLGIYNVGTYENGIHGLPTRWDTGKKIWEGFIGQPATYGCAMLADEDAAVLYKMAYVGMPVHIMP
ncbi:MAG: LysM peptidoglycan-binding domain-containing protein, partial [Chloroflexota bacterium]|nr:LysM peptidoglycan-binding domain-containing protein [Chloroflexota bacterium]